jgi:hypothetical protein
LTDAGLVERANPVEGVAGIRRGKMKTYSVWMVGLLGRLYAKLNAGQGWVSKQLD